MNKIVDKVSTMEIKLGANGKLPQNVARPISYEVTQLVLETLQNTLGEVFIGKSGNTELSLILPNETLNNANGGVGVEISIKVPVTDKDMIFNVEEYEDKLEIKRLEKLDKEKKRAEKIAKDKAIRELKKKQKEELNKMVG